MITNEIFYVAIYFIGELYSFLIFIKHLLTFNKLINQFNILKYIHINIYNYFVDVGYVIRHAHRVDVIFIFSEFLNNRR